MRLKATHLCDSMKNAFSIELTKLPRKIQKMDMKKFCRDFNGNIKMVLDKERQEIEREEQSNLIGTVMRYVYMKGSCLFCVSLYICICIHTYLQG